MLVKIEIEKQKHIMAFACLGKWQTKKRTVIK